VLRKQDGRDPSDLVGLCPHRVSNRLLDGHHLDAGSCSRHCILQPFGNCLATRLQACPNDNNHLSRLSVGLLINSRISATLVWSPLPCAVHSCLVPQRCALLCQYLLDGHKLDSELWSRRFHVLGNRLRSIMSGSLTGRTMTRCLQPSSPTSSVQAWKRLSASIALIAVRALGVQAWEYLCASPVLSVCQVSGVRMCWHLCVSHASTWRACMQASGFFCVSLKSCKDPWAIEAKSSCYHEDVFRAHEISNGAVFESQASVEMEFIRTSRYNNDRSE
jgi:hypothetical protein